MAKSKKQIESYKKNLKPFAKGDPRINRNGRPKGFDEVRALAIEIANEKITKASKYTRLEKMLMDMSNSRNPADRKLFLAYAYGQPPTKVELEGNINHKLTWVEFIALGDDNSDEGKKGS